MKKRKVNDNLDINKKLTLEQKAESFDCITKDFSVSIIDSTEYYGSITDITKNSYCSISPNSEISVSTENDVNLLKTFKNKTAFLDINFLKLACEQSSFEVINLLMKLDIRFIPLDQARIYNHIETFNLKDNKRLTYEHKAKAAEYIINNFPPAIIDSKKCQTETDNPYLIKANDFKIFDEVFNKDDPWSDFANLPGGDNNEDNIGRSTLGENNNW